MKKNSKNQATTNTTTATANANATAKTLTGKALAKYRKQLFANSATGILQAERQRAKMEYLKRLESMDENERLQEMENALNALPVNDTETIADETAQTMGERIAIRALKTTYHLFL